MYETVKDTLFVAKQIIYLPECPSTNDFLLAELNQKTFAEGLVVITDKQSAGKGQRGNVWHTEPGKNLTFSVLFKPTFIAPNKQFYLSMACALAVTDWLKVLGIEKVKVKWPNDVYAGMKKICGILIENQLRGQNIQHTIMGIGVNINQTEFDGLQPTSLFKQMGVEQNLSSSFQELIPFIEKRYLLLKAGMFKQLKQDYLANLLFFGQLQSFEDSSGVFNGIIEDVNEEGRLLINVAGKIKSYDIKEVKPIITYE